MMTRWRILNGNPEPHYTQLLESWSDIADVVTVPAEQRSRIAKMLPEFDVYLAVLGAPIAEADIIQAPRLKMIATPTTGSDHLPVKTILQQGIRLYTLRESPDFLTTITSTAELCWGLLLSLVRHIVPAFRDVCNGQWQRMNFTGWQLSGRTLGIVGYGRLGRILARYGKTFGMRVLANDIRPDIICEPGITSCSLETLLAESDVVSLHIHLDDSNRRFFNQRCFEQMKTGAIFLNTSRGGIVDEQALLAALESGKVSAAGLDVLDNEWDGIANNPLVQYASSHDNLLITPHCGGASLDAQALTFAEMLRHVREFMIQNHAIPPREN